MLFIMFFVTRFLLLKKEIWCFRYMDRDVFATLLLPRHIYPSLVLVQPRKTRPFITERLLMGRKESNQTNKKTLLLHDVFLFFFLLILTTITWHNNPTVKLYPSCHCIVADSILKYHCTF